MYVYQVHSTSIYIALSGEREGLQPSLSPVLQIYDALKSSFVAVFADKEAIADGLNPFTISHTARTISCGNIGIIIRTCSVPIGAMSPILTSAHEIMPDMPKTRPQTDIHLGISFVR